MVKDETRNIPVVIMAGGMGKRAVSIDATVPKPLIRIGNKPVLQWEIECLVRQGYCNIIITVSHMAEKIQAYFGDGSDFGCRIRYYVEKKPLGNAGALFILWANGIINGDFILLNADSMFDIDFDRFVSAHIASGALATLLTHPSSHVFDSGLIIHDSYGWVEKWLTKEEVRPQWYHNSTNAGMHVVNTSALAESGIDPRTVGTDSELSISKVDLDRQVLKPLAGKKKLFAFSSPEYVKDMGTAERFEQVKYDISHGLVNCRNSKNMQKAIFLDRDGTINKYVGFLKDIDQFELLPGVSKAIKKINDSGFLCIVVSNQPVIARGEMSYEELELIHNKMETLLGNEGAYVDAIYYCPHHPDSGFHGEIPELKITCDCRKPKPGMLIRAAKDFNIDLHKSWMIGDGERDIKAGKNAGCKTVLIDSNALGCEPVADFGQEETANSLLSAITLVLE